MKVVVTGGTGKLGQDALQALTHCHEVLSPSHSALDITDVQRVKQFFQAEKPDLVIHSAAIADADLCQQNPRLAYRVNTLGTQNLVLTCASWDTGMAFVSTDYVYDGEKDSPYLEFDPVHPINVYGQSKLTAEEFIQSHLRKYFILRTAWLFGEHGDNFLTGVLAAAEQGKPVQAAFDQTGSPTSTADLSQALLALIETDYYGIYHLVNPGAMTWLEYAGFILGKAGRQTEIIPIRKEQRGPAPRPANTALENFCLEERGIYSMPPVEEAIERCVRALTQPAGRFG